MASFQRREPTLGPGDRERPRRRRKKKKHGSLFGALFYWSLMLGIWGAVGATGLIVYNAAQLPPIDELAVPKRPPNIAILGDDGTLLANRGDTGGAAIPLSELPDYLPKAFIAIEDRRFYEHWGIDPLGILRAVIRDVIGHGEMEGGSTITQQLAKNLFLTQERTLSRKIQEAILAVWLEHKYSKDQILELYLNRVYFGSGAFGVEAASQKYFGHSARTVNLSEAAMLAGLMKAPTRLAPNHNLSAAIERAGEVVNAMEQEGYITAATAKYALAHPAEPVKEKSGGSINYVADYVMDQLNDTIGAINEDIVVSTTISAPLQEAAERALTGELDAKGKKFEVSQGALVALDPSGALVALVGGRSYAESQFNRAVAAKRQPGSAFKPFVYLTALERGLTPNTLRDDAPIDVHGWQPEDYHHQYMGPVTLTTALSLSLNTVAVRLCLEVGPSAVIKTAQRLGLASNLEANPSIALGTSEVTPLELVAAYAPFANGGFEATPYIITRVRTASGRLLYRRKEPTETRVVAPEYVAMMNTMLRETLLSGTARRAELPDWEAAGKTGTSQDWRDAWFVGYTSHIVTGIWVGNDDNSPTKRVSGGGLPVEIWSRFMRVAHRGVPPQGLPGGIWRGSSANPVASLFNFFARPTQNRAAAPSPQPIAVGPTRSSPSNPHDDGGLLPPASIPNGGEAAGDDKPFFGLF